VLPVIKDSAFGSRTYNLRIFTIEYEM